LEADSTPQQAGQNVEQIDSADLAVGILAGLGADEIAEVCVALRTIPGNPRIVVLHNHQGSDPAAMNANAALQDGSLCLVPWPLQKAGAPPALESVLTAYASIFGIGERLGVRGCCVIASKLDPATASWICRLTEPMLESGVDFIAPCYSRRKFDGLLNNSIIYPLMRSLYGRQIQNPMGPDLGVSRRLSQQLLAAGQNGKPSGDGMRLLASIAPQALCGEFQVCQAHLGARIYPAMDWLNVSSLLAEILGPVFLTMERNAACWQKTRNSAPVKSLNQPLLVPQTAGTVDMGKMVSSFQQGIRDLQEIWGLVLPPTTLLEIRKLSRAASDQFHFPDELWARIVYDFALAHRLRTINRDHLLRSLTPFYLGWVASYAGELENADAAAVERRIERLALAYEAEKPYLVSRWRWPDRFNP
jgi:glucosylglycerate synthase